MNELTNAYKKNTPANKTSKFFQCGIDKTNLKKLLNKIASCAWNKSDINRCTYVWQELWTQSTLQIHNKLSNDLQSEFFFFILKLGLKKKKWIISKRWMCFGSFNHIATHDACQLILNSIHNIERWTYELNVIFSIKLLEDLKRVSNMRHKIEKYQDYFDSKNVNDFPWNWKEKLYTCCC